MEIYRDSMAKELSEIQIKVGLSLKELISAIKELDEEDREFLIENLIAMLSSEYQESIREAREDYKAGRVISHEELFKDL